MNRLLTTLAVAIPLALGMPAVAQVQLDHDTAQTLTDLGIDTSQVKDQETSATSTRSSLRISTPRPRKPNS